MPLFSQCLAGLVTASQLFVLAAGLTLTAGATRRLNVSQRLSEIPQLAATLGVLLIVQDVTPRIWNSLGREIDDLVLIAIGPLVLVILLLLLNRTRWGSLVRTADPTRGNEPIWRFASVAALAAGLAGLAGALTPPALGLTFLTDSIIVALIGGLGSITGAYAAALVIGLLQAFLPDAAPFLAFAVLAATLIVRPYGLLGRSQPDSPVAAILICPTPLSARLLFAAALAGALAAPFLAGPAILSLLTQALIAILFAASLHVMMGPGGMPSLGHAAFFGIGAYAAAVLVRDAGADMSLALLAAPLAAGAAAFLAGALIVRLPGLELAMLTLVFAQLVWTLAARTGGAIPIRPAAWATPPVLYWFTLALCIGVTLLLRRALYGPFGYALRAVRDDPVRAAAIGLPSYRLRLSAFTLAGTTAGLAGGLAAFNQGGASPADVTIDKSAEALLMVLLGGLQTISGPIIGALAATGLRDAVLQATTAWRPVLGLALIAVVLLLPQGIAGSAIRAWRRAL